MADQQKRRSSTIVILLGFAAILTLISILTVITFFSISSNSNSLNKIVTEQQHITDIYTMRDAAQARALNLFRMMSVNDNFVQDDIYLQFKAEAGRFIEAKDHLLSTMDTPSTLKIFDTMSPYLTQGSQVQNETVELIHEEKYDEASTFIQHKVIPIQDKVADDLYRMLETQNANIQSDLQTAQEKNNRYYIYLFSLSAAAFLIGLFITYYVYNYTRQTEQALLLEQQAAEKANQAKSSFLANMSHEIRTPLTAIIGFSEQILNAQLNQEEQQHLKQTIVRNSKHLQHLVNDILDLSKIESGQLELEMTAASPAEITHEVETIISKRALDKNLYFKVNNIFPLPSFIITDSVRLKQVLLNLCGNAIKFSSTGGITLETSYNTETNMITFSVIDTGIGLNEEEQKKIFQPFTQADVSTTRNFGGTGLGLSISRLLATEMEGTLECTSIKDQGSKFSLTLPTGVSGKIKMLEASESYTPVKDNSLDNIEVKPLRGKILLAEDTVDNQALISLYVKQTGAELEIANNGEEAIQKALGKTFDLILMDMQMPRVDGIEAISTLRKTGYKGPIVTLTANALAADRDRSMTAGANGFLAKPIDVNEFYGVLNKYLQEKTASENNGEEKARVTTGLDRLKEKFINDLPDRINKLNTALEKNSWQDIDQVSHYLKGVADTFGCPMITELSQNLNNAVRERDYDEVHRLIKALQQEANSVIAGKTGSLSS